ncbi:MAG TPA: Fic family protein [Anaeromyxobacteraceae bacterium]|nr:Fic family protein [Anaeromyxobacteraceae bacterium]
MRSRYLDLEDRTQDLAQLLNEEPALAQEFFWKYELSWIYHENALEGVVFTGQELAAALTNQPLAEASSVSAHRGIRNFKVAIDLVRSEAATKKPRITHELVYKLYETIHAGVEARSGAELRKDIPLHRAYFHDIAHPSKIAPQLQKLVDWCDSPEFRNAHAIHKASKLHHAFMQVYPYSDGSGTIARLLANLLLIHANLQPCIIHTIDRQRYYESLRLPETALRELMMDSMENGLANGEKFLRQALAAKAKKAAH